MKAQVTLKEAIILDPTNEKYRSVMAGLNCQIKEDKFLHWMKKSSATINKLKIENHSEHEKSIVASAPIEAGEIILHAPIHQLMTFERFKQWSLGGEIL